MSSETALTTRSAALMQWTPEQKALIRRQICPTFNDDQLAYALAFCTGHNYDPLAREIHFWSQDGKVMFQVSIDTMRSRATQCGVRGLNSVAIRAGDKVSWKVGQIPDIAIDPTKKDRGELVGFYAWAYRDKQLSVLWVPVGEALSGRGVQRSLPETMGRKIAEGRLLRQIAADAIGGVYEDSEAAMIRNESAGEPMDMKQADAQYRKALFAAVQRLVPTMDKTNRTPLLATMASEAKAILGNDPQNAGDWIKMLEEMDDERVKAAYLAAVAPAPAEDDVIDAAHRPAVDLTPYAKIIRKVFEFVPGCSEDDVKACAAELVGAGVEWGENELVASVEQRVAAKRKGGKR